MAQIKAFSESSFTDIVEKSNRWLIEQSQVIKVISTSHSCCFDGFNKTYSMTICYEASIFIDDIDRYRKLVEHAVKEMIREFKANR